MADQYTNIRSIINAKINHFLTGDVPRLLMLTSLYICQGFAFGFTNITLPIKLKQHFSYTQIGLLAFCSLGYKIKFLFSPLVDTKYIAWLGKRKSWILPTHILLICMLYYLGSTLDELMEQQRIYTIFGIFLTLFILLSIQDIAVDGWAITIVKKENLAYAASVQMNGMKIGSFVSTTVFLALNSVDFCNHFIYFTPSDTPILTEQSYMMIWCFFIIIVTLYVMIFVNENDDRTKISKEEEVTSVYEVISITRNFIFNKNILKFMLFLILCICLSQFGPLISKTYLLNDLKYSQEKFTLLNALSFPLQVVATTYLSKFVYERPLERYLISRVTLIIAELLMINFVMYNYEYLSTNYTFLTDLMLFVLMFVMNISITMRYICEICFGKRILNVAVAATHVTLFNSLGNLVNTTPALYSYMVVDYFDLFWPNLVGCVISIVIIILMIPRAKQFQNMPKEAWGTHKTKSD